MRLPEDDRYGYEVDVIHLEFLLPSGKALEDLVCRLVNKVVNRAAVYENLVLGIYRPYHVPWELDQSGGRGNY